MRHRSAGKPHDSPISGGRVHASSTEVGALVQILSSPPPNNSSLRGSGAMFDKTEACKNHFVIALLEGRQNSLA